MNINQYTITEQEHEILKERTAEILQFVQEDDGDFSGKLCKYAQNNGYSETEASTLVESVVIPTVDEYNTVCRENIDSDMKEWIQEKIDVCTEDMTLEEECRYKLGVLMALKGMNETILKQAGIQKCDYEELNEDELERLEQGNYTREMLVQINEELVDAIENSGLELEMSNRFEKLLEGTVDAESVHTFVMELWQDEQYKYCLSVAACVAKKQGELPSIPEETSDEVLVIGICQGVDIANVEMQASTGKIGMDKAHKILKVIAKVGLAFLVSAGMFLLTVVTGATILEFAKKIYDNLLVQILIVGAVGILTFAYERPILEKIKKVVKSFDTISDFLYERLKEGSQKVNQFVYSDVGSFLKEKVEKMCIFFKNIIQYLKQKKNRVSIKCNV